MLPFIDIHTHAFGKGIAIVDMEESYLIYNSEKDMLKGNTSICEVPTKLYLYSAGIHPLKILSEGMDNVVERLSEVLQWKRVVAVGECGLDRRSASSIEYQREVFLKQVELGNRWDKPLIIHCVKAYSDLIAIHNNVGKHTPWIIHGYNNNSQILDQLLNHGFYISLGAAICKRSNASNLLPFVPQDRLLLESDDANIDIELVYKRTAALLKLDEEIVKQQLIWNFDYLFPGHMQEWKSLQNHNNNGTNMA